MIVYFVRHGQTDDNKEGIIQGHLDTPLNDYGRNEAKLLGRRLKNIKFYEAWSSSLSRAKETAEIVLQHHPGLQLRTDPGLMERCLGSLQGRRRLKGEKLPDDIEQGDIFRKRITDWFTSFLASQPPSSPSDPERKILVASHGAYLTTLLSILLSPPFSYAVGANVDIRASCYNTSIMKVYIRRLSDLGQLQAGKLASTQGISEEDHDGIWRDIVERRARNRAEGNIRSKNGSIEEWAGVVLSWADVRHLDTQWEDMTVADDVS